MFSDARIHLKHVRPRRAVESTTESSEAHSNSRDNKSSSTSTAHHGDTVVTTPRDTITMATGLTTTVNVKTDVTISLTKEPDSTTTVALKIGPTTVATIPETTGKHGVSIDDDVVAMETTSDSNYTSVSDLYNTIDSSATDSYNTTSRVDVTMEPVTDYYTQYNDTSLPPEVSTSSASGSTMNTTAGERCIAHYHQFITMNKQLSLASTLICMPAP